MFIYILISTYFYCFQVVFCREDREKNWRHLLAIIKEIGRWEFQILKTIIFICLVLRRIFSWTKSGKGKVTTNQWATKWTIKSSYGLLSWGIFILSTNLPRRCSLRGRISSGNSLAIVRFCCKKFLKYCHFGLLILIQFHYLTLNIR